MRQLSVTMNLSLDGVLQAPGGPDEDTRDGFSQGGWSRPYMDDVAMASMSEGMSQAGVMLFGRRTYEQFAGYWPEQKDNPFTDHLNAVHKYVVSTSAIEPLPWVNSTLLRGDAVESVGALKSADGSDISVIGSGRLVGTLLRAGLVDELTLLIHPLVLGAGRRIFEAPMPTFGLELVQSTPTTTGVIMATYRPAAVRTARQDLLGQDEA